MSKPDLTVEAPPNMIHLENVDLRDLFKRNAGRSYPKPSPRPLRRSIRYQKRRKYKYTLAEDYVHRVAIQVRRPGTYGFLCVYSSGLLRISVGYAWDGASGPAFDTKSFMRGSLVHDALSALLRVGALAQDQRKRADEILREICLEDGMSRVRAWWIYRGVRVGGAKSARPGILTAP